MNIGDLFWLFFIFSALQRRIQYIDVHDSEEVLRAIHLTDPEAR